MAALVPVQLNFNTGGAATFVAMSAGGDTFKNNGRSLLMVSNASGAAITVTITAQNSPVIEGIAVPAANLVFTIANGAFHFFPPIPTSIFNNSNGEVSITYSTSSASIAVAVMILP